uniref:Centromere/kinetochore protein zw10 homolog n=1 Tax=Mesocestoides corti TaxID=53468 RepID=A0A5K3F007_MESCO
MWNCTISDTMTDSHASISGILQEYKSSPPSISVVELTAQLNSLKESICSKLNEFHRDFRPVSEQITQNAAELRRLQITIDALNAEYASKVKSQMEGLDPAEALEGTGVPCKRLPRLMPSEIHSRAVEQLEAVLKLQASCQHLLRVHTCLECLGDRIYDLIRRCRARRSRDHFLANADSRKQVVFEKEKEDGSDWEEDDDEDDLDDFDDDEDDVGAYGDGDGLVAQVPPNCGDIEAEVAAIVACLRETEKELSVETFYEKSEVVLFQSFMRTWVDHKRELRDFIDRYWHSMVRVYSNPDERNIVCKLEIHGTPPELTSLVTLMGAMHETQMRIENVAEEIWKQMFIPWLESISGKIDSRTSHLRFNVTEDLSLDHAEIWCLELVSIDGEDLDSTENIGKESTAVIQDVCRQLTNALRDLDNHLFGLSDGTGSRLIDYCVPAVDVFNVELARRLLDDFLTPNLPTAAVVADNGVLQVVDDETSKFILATNSALWPLITTAKECGFFQEKAVTCLSDFLDGLTRLTNQRQEQAYLQSLMRILEKYENFASLERVGVSKLGQQTPSTEASDDNKENAKMSEEQLEAAELAKMFHNVHLEFPACYISKAVVHLLGQIDQIIGDAERLLDRGLARDVGSQGDALAPRLVQSLLHRVPRLIFLYSHCVPTLHAERMKHDLRFIATYHNDCMYLAHECLTLGRCKLYPLAERLLGDDDEAEATAALRSLQGLASISTLQLVSPLRRAATSSLLEHLRTQKTLLDESFKLARGLKDAAGEGRDACERAILTCTSQLLRIFKEFDVLPVSVFLRILGVLADEFVRLLCDAVVRLDDITTMDCAALVRLISSVIESITRMFETHLDAAFDPAFGSSFAKTETKVCVAVCRFKWFSAQNLPPRPSIWRISSRRADWSALQPLLRLPTNESRGLDKAWIAWTCAANRRGRQGQALFCACPRRLPTSRVVVVSVRTSEMCHFCHQPMVV